MSGTRSLSGRGIGTFRTSAVSGTRARRRPPSASPAGGGHCVEAVERRVLFASLWVSDAVVTEGNAGTTNAVFTVTLFQPSEDTVTVNYATASSTAVTPDDYAVGSGTLTFTPGGPTSQTVTVPVVPDTLQEANEQFLLNLSGPTNANIVGAEGRAFIADDDEAFLTIHNVQVAEKSAGTNNAVLTVTRSGSTAGTTTVNFATTPGTATSPADFGTASGTLTFAPGVTTQTVSIPVAADALDEPNETFFVGLAAATNATVTAGSASVTVVDDDASSFTIDGVAVQEGTTPGTSAATVTVTRHGSLGGPGSVSYATSNNSAVAGEDFVQTTGTLTFAAGDATETITVPIAADGLQEADERFFVNLSNAQNGSIAETTAEVYVIDDDAGSFVVEGSAVAEGDAGVTPLLFTVRRFGSLAAPASINYATSNSNAAAPGDYAQTNGTLTFAAGESVKTVSVPVVADNLQEPAEAFLLNLSSSTNGTIVETSAVGVVIDDDESFFTIANVTNARPEGDAGTTALARFVVERHGSLDGAASVNFATTNGTAVTPSDYAVANGTLAFAPGETTREVSVTISGDATAEANEYFGVTLAAAQNATIAENAAYCWIVNDDGAIATSYFFPRDAIVSEGDAANVTMTFAVQRWGAVGAAASVNYALNNGTALQNQDFQGAAGTLSFAAGETEKSFTVTVLPDGLDEATETFGVSFTGAVGGTVADTSVQGMIVDDDDISLYVNDVSTQEGDVPVGDVRFTVTRFGETSGTTSINYSTVAGTATTPSDFQTSSGTLNFAPGDTTREIVARVVGDTLQEGAEYYTVSLAAPVNGTVVGTTGLGWVVDDEESLIYADDVSVTEGTGAAGTTATFTVRRFGDTDGTSTVTYSTVNGTATQPGDFAGANGTLSFAPGESTKQVVVTVAADTLQEASETFQLDLTAPTNGTVVGGRGAGRLVDDDLSHVGVSGVTVDEGNAGATEAAFTVTRFGSTAGASSVEFRTAASSATSPGDFTAVITTVNFAPGEVSRAVTVPVVPDTLQEVNEQFNVSLAGAQNTTALAASQPVYLIDEDRALLYVTAAAAVEGNPDAPATMTFTVHRVGSTAGTATVNYAAAASSATTPADFAAASGTLSFAPGVAGLSVAVPLVSDLTRETLEEAFFLNLSAPQNATTVAGSALGTVLDDDPAPAVTRVYVSGTDWAGDDGNPANITFKEYLQAWNFGSVDYGVAIPAGAGQVLTLPWINLNRVSITFSQEVTVDRNDLSVRGTNLPTYTFAAGDAGFRYDALSRTATWTFAAPLEKDRILLDLDASQPNGVRNAGGELLDGEWTNGADAYPSGNGTGGGDFLYRLNVLPGDTTRDNVVLAQDYSDVKKRFFKNTSSPVTGSESDYNPFYDLDTSGSILARDYSEVKKQFFSTLPATLPTGASGLFGEAAAGDGLLRELLA